jgi:hypothetical protein
MKRSLVLVFSLIFATISVAGVRVIASGNEPLDIPFKEGLGLIESLEHLTHLSCCNVKVSRGDKLLQVDLARALGNLKSDWSLEDGDTLYIPEHVFGCMNSSDSATFLTLIHEYLEIRRGRMTEPRDWQQRIERMPTHE